MHTQPLLVEIRCEELPPAQVHALAADFPRRLLAALQQANFAAPEAAPACAADGAPWQLATPRRFAALLGGIRSEAARTTLRRRGPLLAACYDAQQRPTRALQGFMQAVGAADAAALTQAEEKGKTYIAFDDTRGGEPLHSALAGIVQSVLLAVTAPRLMRWGDNEFKFIRPLRGVLLLHGGEVLRGEVLGVAATAESIGHPALAPQALALPAADAYVPALAASGAVLADIRQRRDAIVAQLNGAPAPPALLEELTALCEQPGVYQGTLDSAFSQLPAFCVQECLVTHQRAFPAAGAEGADAAAGAAYYFVADNRPPDAAAIIRGMNTVLRARLRDVQFYLQEDAKLSADAALQKLESITYHRALGSQRARVQRLQAAAQWLGARLHLPPAQQAHVQQAAMLCKCDLPTLMVGEYPQLEGRIAELLFCAEMPAVAALVRCHNQRITAQSEVAAPAQALMLAVQLEKLLGMFAAGERPSGSKDPHGLRAAAATAAVLLTQCARAFSLDEALAAAAAPFGGLADAESVAAVRAFVVERKRQQLLEQGAPAAVLNAVLARPFATLLEVEEKAAALTQFLQLPQAAALSEAHKRTDNILRKSAAAAAADAEDGALPAVDESLLHEAAEKALHAALRQRAQENAAAAAAHDYAALLQNTAALHAAVHAFFEQVHVNAEDARLRANRLALLAALRDQFNSVGELSRLSGG